MTTRRKKKIEMKEKICKENLKEQIGLKKVKNAKKKDMKRKSSV